MSDKKTTPSSSGGAAISQWDLSLYYDRRGRGISLVFMVIVINTPEEVTEIIEK
jgi:hypothetical protein